MAEVMDGKTERNPWHGDVWSAIPGLISPADCFLARDVYF